MNTYSSVVLLDEVPSLFSQDFNVIVTYNSPSHESIFKGKCARALLFVVFSGIVSQFLCFREALFCLSTSELCLLRQRNQAFGEFFFSCWYNTLKANRVCRWAFAVGGVNTYHNVGAVLALCGESFFYKTLAVSGSTRPWDPSGCLSLYMRKMSGWQWNNYGHVKTGSTNLVSYSRRKNCTISLSYRISVLVASWVVSFSLKITLQCIDSFTSFPGIKK